MRLIVSEKIRKIFITFSVAIKKKCDDNKTITHKLRFIDSFRFTNFSLSDLVDNLSGRVFSSVVRTKGMFCRVKKSQINLQMQKMQRRM